MSTSGSTNFIVNRDQLIAGALRVIGAIAQGESPTDVQTAEADEALNILIKAWQADGMPLWAIKEYAITLTASTASYQIGVGKTVNTPKPMRISSAYLHNTDNSIDIPMIPLTRDEYNRLGNKTSTGQPSQYYYDVQIDSGTLYLFPVPDATAAANTTVKIVYQRPFEDFDSTSDTPDFPQEWFQALKFGLAEVLAPEYGVPLETYGHLRKVAKDYKDQALSFGTEEGSFYFKADRNPW